MTRALDSALRHRVCWLGYAGLLPLVFASLMLLDADMRPMASDIVTNYTAVILAFVGAIHWGRGLHTAEPALFSLSVLPTMLAFSCLLLSPRLAWPLLAIGLISLLLFDVHEYRGLAWFRRLRMRLTLAVTTLLLIDWVWLYWSQRNLDGRLSVW